MQNAILKIKNKDFFFIEINPRLTTSYIGIRNIINKNPAELIINSTSKSNNIKDIQIKIQKNSIFTKLDLIYKSHYDCNLIIPLKNTIPKRSDLQEDPFITNFFNEYDKSVKLMEKEDDK